MPPGAPPSAPVLHLLAGPNGSGKSAYAERVLEPRTHLPFVNADVIAARLWPDDAESHAYDASQLAAEERDRLLAARSSFITETVFSHPSKVDLVRRALAAGYLVELHVVLVPEGTSVARVGFRVARGGHSVPERKIRERYERLWSLVALARDLATSTTFYDNTSARDPYRVVAVYEAGVLVSPARWPAWTPSALL
ncbi:ATPase [Aeromicrobium sp. Root495]|nr:ATPase [Aeromicrobium sp. Root495]